jgi:hypothetical protein
MMSNHVVLLRGEEKYTPRLSSDSSVNVIRFNGSENNIGSNVLNLMKQWSYLPSPTALDLLDTSIAAVMADKLVKRQTESWDGWTRDIRLHVAVRDVNLWQQSAGKALCDLLQFLSGDRWHLEFRAYAKNDVLPEGSNKLLAQGVILFSGGLDSFVGAIDEITSGHNVLLVSHHGRGAAGGAAKSQKAALSTLRTKYPHLQNLSYFVASPERQTPGKKNEEESSRSRALLFYALGTVTALAVGAKRMIVPENGHVSLNVPLTNSHLGSASTRSTHPNTIHLWNKLLEALNIQMDTVLPYHYMTKGEVLTHCKDVSLLKLGMAETVSCGNPNVAVRDSNLSETLRKPGIHCGYCWACLVRRAAIQAAFNTDSTPYAYSDPRLLTGDKVRSVYAARFALNREGTKPTMARVLSAGPLPMSTDNVKDFLAVYRRGQKEIRAFLEGYGLSN